MVSVRRLQALLLAMSLSGCVSGPADAPGPDEDTLVPTSVTDAGDVVAQDRGVIRGRVHDDANLSVAGARIFLVGWHETKFTQADGGFSFHNVTAGPHLLRVEPTEYYQVREVEVEILAGKSITVNVRLLPLEGRGAGYLPHKHDYWGEQTEITLMDEEFRPYDTYNRYQPTSVYSFLFIESLHWAFASLGPQYQFRLPKISDDQEPIIFPGTKEIQITLTWSQGVDATHDELGFAFRHANMTTNENPILTETKPSGQTITVPVEPDWADNGHQTWTLWDLYIHPGWEIGSRPDYYPGSIHVEFVIVKGEVPPEEGHRDFWGQETQLTLIEGERTVTSSIFGRDSPNGMVIDLDKGVLVPPGSVRMRIELWWNHTDYPQINKDIGLIWHPGNMHPDAWPEEWVTKEPVDEGTNFLLFDFELEPGQADAFYQKASNWRWKMTFPEDDILMLYVAESWDVDFTVTVWRDGGYDPSEAPQ